MTRFITFRFDDGYMDGARKVADCLRPDLASFFIVTGPVSGTHKLEHMEEFRGRNFGSLDEWRALAALGHDIQPHSVSHPDFRKLSRSEQRIEVQRAVSFVSLVHTGPYIFCFPYNSISDIALAPLGLAAAGFLTQSSDQEIIFNKIDAPIDLFKLRSWAVRERHFQFVVEQLDRLPDQSWTILAFHSLDGEGHEPWTTDSFCRLISFMRKREFRFITTRMMVETLASKVPQRRLAVWSR